MSAETAIVGYHQRTKHHPRRFAAGPHGLDWATQPHPFRRWEGAELLPLPRPGPRPEPAYGTALVAGSVDPAMFSKDTVSELCFDSLALSAWKQAGPSRWALRVNPSSGNLHPTEGYLLLPATPGLGEEAAVYHYAPLEHGLERRATIPADLWARLTRDLPEGAFLVGLSSIHWREAWKYGERAFRYCQHDVGHAIAAFSFAAAGLGWRVALLDSPGTDEVASLLGTFTTSGVEAEHADCLLVVGPGEVQGADLAPGAAAEFRTLAWQGTPNRLSPDHREWSTIDDAARAARKPRTAEPSAAWRAPEHAAAPPAGGPGLRTILRQRRSGVAFDRRTGLSAPDFHRLLESLLPHRGRLPFDAFPWRPRIDLLLFVHRVEGYEPGLHWLAREGGRAEAVRAALRGDFTWERPALAPSTLPLFRLRSGDVRAEAMDLSCNQDIAADGALSLGMVAELEPSLARHGAWFYPRLFWEAGAIGQRLYVEAEAVGRRGTGIGCFFDDEVHGLLGLRGLAYQSLYHFTLGGPVEDPRIQTLPPYAHLRDGRDG